MKSVAIEREFGSGGRDIGIRIAKEAQIPYYDGQLLIEAAKGYGIEIATLKEFDENKVGSFLYNIAMMAVSYTHLFPFISTDFVHLVL